MKFGKITAANISTNALSLGGALAGAALSGGIMTVVPQDMALIARGGMTGVGLLGAAAIKGKSTADTLVKMALLGVGIAQGSQLIKHFAGQTIQVDETSSVAQKFIAGAAGLACPCDRTPALASPVINFPALSAIQEQEYTESEEVLSGAF